MAKKEKKDSKAKSEARKAKNQEVQNNYQLINDMDGVKTEALAIRNYGVLVRETSTNGVCSTFIPDTKVKKKGVNYTLVKDTQEMRDSKAAKRAENKKKKAKKK